MTRDDHAMMVHTIEAQARYIAAMKAVDDSNRACWTSTRELLAGAIVSLSLGNAGIEQALVRLNLAIETAAAMSKTAREIAAEPDSDLTSERERCAGGQDCGTASIDQVEHL